jgi:hypothetical protein
MELMNKAIVAASGEDPRLNVFQAPQLGPHYLKHYLHIHGQSAESSISSTKRKTNSQRSYAVRRTQ